MAHLINTKKNENVAFVIDLSGNKQEIKEIVIGNSQITIDSKNEYCQIILSALRVAFDSEWFKDYGDYTKRSHATVFKQFAKWLNSHEITERNKFFVLNEYQTFRVNECGVKLTSSGVNLILILFKKLEEFMGLEEQVCKYLISISEHTNIARVSDVSQTTITTWFEQITWLEKFLDERDYEKIGSPSEILPSFIITVSVLLLHIIETKRTARTLLEKFETIFSSELLIPVHRFENEFERRSAIYDKRRHDREQYIFRLISIIFDAQNKQVSTPIKELIYLDIAKQKYSSEIEARVAKCQSGIESWPKHHRWVSMPNILASDSWEHPSEFEETLFSFLCSWQTVQPFDIPKLKKRNFSIARYNSGHPLSIQCTYYKSRSDREHKPFLIDANEIEGKAIYAYIENFQLDESKLFIRNSSLNKNLSFGSKSFSELFAKALQIQSIGEKIQRCCEQRKKSTIFKKAFLVLYDHKENSYVKWLNKKKYDNIPMSTQSDYKNETTFWLPQNFIPQSAIKNSSIHSRSEKFRKNDPVNFNSHTAKTEERSYLTDANKEWMNLNGRITRRVMQEIETTVYKPNLNLSIARAKDLISKTLVIAPDKKDTTTSLDINTLGRYIPKEKSKETYDVDAHEILVIESEDTVLLMLHYIEQTTTNQKQLIHNCIEFFEKKALPTAEWMETLLATKLSPLVVKRGKKIYEELKSDLPPLFTNEIRASGLT